MFDQNGHRKEFEAAYQRWERDVLEPALRRAPEQERNAGFTTISGQPIKRLYTPLDLADTDPINDIGFPGQFPFTRGIHPTGYRGKLWTMRMFAGFGTAEETNARFRYLLSQGQTGLSVAFDMPTLYGRDTDHPLVEGEFGKCGVAVSSLADMEILFDGIPLDQVTTSMTINSPAIVIWAMYIAAAEKRGIPMERLGGTIQNDILKEYAAQNEYIFPIEPSMRLVVDTIEFAARHMPKWNPISVSGYHIREAGATAVQELAFTLADGLAYVKACLKRGLDIDSFAPRISFFFNAHNDFFEEIAKYRAARRIWARQMRDVFGAKNPRSWWLRFHTQTAGVSLTAQQPEINIVRVAIQALAAVLGGTQSLHTDAMDEALALPSEKAATIALRTQQIIAEESGVINTVDPLGGSYFVEALTNEMERQCLEYFRRIEEQGGMEAALEKGWIQREIAEAAYRFQREVDDGQRGIVGVNKYVEEAPIEIPILEMDPEGERRHLERLNRVRRERDNERVRETLAALRAAAQGDQNLMYPVLDCVRAYATLGEICDVLREVFGVYREATVI
ncbi:acyl-CoA mutase large subunit family protein [Kallotenue papyrolyticum]|uniref:acyl-CoA mutase large subunit family protein n=1 Tax=Kallotenue papyrolyticum TaxID=1325125 RepID=UPI0004785CC3|nr:methylmalonyl-CoA mutase family protein [Kallotenue papyrolyticum]